jgi:phage tail tube protein FII
MNIQNNKKKKRTFQMGTKTQNEDFFGKRLRGFSLKLKNVRSQSPQIKLRGRYLEEDNGTWTEAQKRNVGFVENGLTDIT